ncbi:protein transporter [Cryptococcus bacillisporus CA1873]|uniref:Trafficking protein particle complex subunit n=1 Tax=Cryptococcus bacillisporus CA1873 TaxID=1296111 RepID=A0ABR5B252_CRYGA|nr:protein transporter [Cryptococcus bacillisporus CA1873]|eukprot:KIR57675.1 protein transporter [Cryptococcus gattii CA1873]
MTIHALWIISKAGGLVFSRSYSDALPQLPVNTILTLAGILHGIHAITARLTPSPATSSHNQSQGPASGSTGGLESFEAEGWGGKVFLTPTEWIRWRSMSSKSKRRERLPTDPLSRSSYLYIFWGQWANRHKVCIVTFATASRLGRSS